jgi:hypothetical protein
MDVASTLTLFLDEHRISRTQDPVSHKLSRERRDVEHAEDEEEPNEAERHVLDPARSKSHRGIGGADPSATRG